MRRTAAALALLAPLALAACSSGADAPEDTMTTSENVAPEPTETATEEPAGPVDRTAEIQALDPAVQTATETEPGRLDIVTTIVDPRGDAGSPEAQQAIALCEGAVLALGESAVRVSIQEEDGTTFVVYSQTPLPGDLPTGECVEY